MQFLFSQIDARERYKLLTGVIVPRPIALTTTLSLDGHVNAAPFSFFNCMGSDPALVVLGIGDRSFGDPKDSARNIRLTREFVVNLVDEAIVEKMNTCAIDFPPGMDELAIAGFTPLPSVTVKPPRIAESPVNMECRETATVELGRNRIVVGEVLAMHIRDDCVDAANFHVYSDRLHSIGRMQAPGWYAKTNDMFMIPRLTYEQWKKKEEK